MYIAIYFIDTNQEIIYDTPINPQNNTETNFCRRNEAYNALDTLRPQNNEITIYENTSDQDQDTGDGIRGEGGGDTASYVEMT